MASFSIVVCFLRKPIPWMALLVLIFISSSTSYSGFFSFLVPVLLLIFSAIYHFKFTEQRQLLEDEPLQVQAQPLCSEQSFDSQVEESENSANCHKLFQENQVDLVKQSTDSYSETEVVDQYSSTSEDSDIDWPFTGSPDCSDGSISDEESLIEIALASGHYVGSKDEDEKEEEVKFGYHQKCKNLTEEAIFGQRTLMELLTEFNDVNEEENLIEIDISMGSIKCSRFEIEA